MTTSTERATWIVGSTMYGLNTSESDTDYTHIVHNHKDFRNPLKERDWSVTSDENNTTTHSASKFARLLVKGNFNAVDLVFFQPGKLNPHDGLIDTLLKRVVPYVLTKQLAAAYMGYVSSMKRLAPNTPQNPARKEQVERLGYDAKFVMHLLRGVYTLRGILNTHEYHYLTPIERSYLKRVKSGVMSLADIEKVIADEIAAVSEEYKDNTLPDNTLLVHTIENTFMELA